MAVSEERRRALRGFFELSQRGQNRGVTFVEVDDVLGVLDDLDAAEKRERITAKALEDMLRGCCNQSDKHRQAAAAISVRREREILELQTICCCCGKPRGDDPVDRQGNAWCDDCAVGARLQWSKTRQFPDPPCPLHAPDSGSDSPTAAESPKSEPTAALHSDGRGDAACGHCGAVIECRHDERFLTAHRPDCPLSEVR